MPLTELLIASRLSRSPKRNIARLVPTQSPLPSTPIIALMSQRDKRIPKETEESSQYRAEVAATKKRREALHNKKILKEQGVGSTIPASRKAKASQEANPEDSPDEDYDVALAEVRAEEARIDALRAKVAARDGLRFKDLRTKDEAKLEAMWNNKTGDKGKGAATGSSSSARKSQVQSMGPARRIVSAPASSTTKRSSTKRKRSSTPSGTKSSNGKESDKAKTSSVDKDDAPRANDDDAGSDSGRGVEGEGDEDEDEVDEEDGETDEEDGARKSKKVGKGKAQRGKTSDFTGVIKKLVNHTTARMCAIQVTSGMFCARREYNSRVKKAWAVAAAEFGVDPRSEKYKLQKEHKQTIGARVNSFRSRIRAKLKPTVPTVYGLSSEGLAADDAKQRVEQWFPHAYHTKVGAAKGFGHFQHSYIQQAIYESYYTGQNPIGIAYPKLFDPMPLEAMGLVCAVIKWIMQQHDTGRSTSKNMNFEDLRDNYDEAMESLKAFKTGIQADQCAFVQKSLYLRSMEQAGCAVGAEEPKPSDRALSDNDFAEDVLTEEELKMIAGTSAKPIRTPRHDNHLSPPNISRSLQMSSSLERVNADHDTIERARFSSVSLDQEEEETEESHETTPTPHARHNESASTRRLTMPADDDDDDEDSDAAKSQNSGLDTEDSEEEAQHPPKKKAKLKEPEGFLGKLVAGSQTHKAAPGKGILLDKLKVSQNGSQKARPKSNLRIQ